MPNVKAPSNNEFIITMKKGPKKTDSMKFSTDHRADLFNRGTGKCVGLGVGSGGDGERGEGSQGRPHNRGTGKCGGMGLGVGDGY